MFLLSCEGSNVSLISLYEILFLLNKFDPLVHGISDFNFLHLEDSILDGWKLSIVVIH